jgi:hypothetical protein
MFKLISGMFVILNLALSAISYAKQIDISLDAPDYMIQQHSGNVLIGIRYSNGDLSSWNLFSREELRKGIKSKTVNIRDDSNITVCDFQWTIMENPPLTADGNTSFLVYNSEFNGVVHKNCTIDTLSGTAKLVTGFLFQNITIKVNGSALSNHNSALLTGLLKIEGIDKPFSFDHSKVGYPGEWNIHVLNSTDILKGNLSLTWYTDIGTTIEESIPLSSLIIEVK